MERLSGDGTSQAFRDRVDGEIERFWKRWGWMVDPLVVPVGLEVVVRPNAAMPPAVLHDLDNVVREYLIPRMVPSFGTVLDYRWTIDFDELRRTNPERARMWRQFGMPPKGTKAGVTGYQVWRIPPVAGEPGFVSVALAAEWDGKANPFRLLDNG